MAASLHRLRSKPERLKAEQAAELIQMILDFPELPPQPVSAIVAAVDRQTAARNGWTFVMLSPAQNQAVVTWLLDHSSRPMKAVRLWAIVFDHLRQDTAEIALTRDEMAELISDSADSVSRIMGELESIGAISRRREKVPGMRGQGAVRYFMNPNVATHLTGGARDKAQAATAPVRLVHGGAPRAVAVKSHA
jgi:hypothetical protein